MTDKLPAATKESDSIQVENFNGLNLVASKLNIPYEQTPHILNCGIDPGGTILKRGGTAQADIQNVDTTVNSIQDIEYQTPDGYNWVIRKIGRECYIYQLIEDSLVPYTNGGTNPVKIGGNPVWSAGAANVQVASCISSITSTPEVFIASGVDSIKEIIYTTATQIFTAKDHAPTGIPANWTGTNFPRTVGIWDGRLYAGGTPNGPAKTWASKSGDFQNFTSGTTANDGFAFELYDVRDQRITQISPFSSALFIFTRQGLFALTPATYVSGSGSSAGVVTPTNLKISKIASIGAVNAQCVTPVEKTLHFLADTGVYELTESTTSSPYQAGELTVMIQPLFKDLPTAPLELCSAAYDAARREYWVTLPAKGSTVPNKLYVYKVVRKAWTEYDLGVYGTRQVFRHISNVTDTAGRRRILTEVVGTGGASSKYWCLVWNTDRVGQYTDFKQLYTGDGSTVVFTFAPTGLLSPVYNYTIPTPATALLACEFPFDPVNSVVDLAVSINSVPTTNYIKVGANRIQITSPLVSGDNVSINYIKTDHAQVRVDNIILEPNIDYRVSGDSFIMNTPPANNSKVEGAITYQAEFDTYELNFGSLRNWKRLRTLYVYATAIEDIEQFKLSDVNSASGQVPDSIVFQPKSYGHLDLQYWLDGRLVDAKIIEDIYYNPAGIWDAALWDQTYPAGIEDEVLILNLEGLCRYVTLRFKSKNAGAFAVPGYQLDILHKGRR